MRSSRRRRDLHIVTGVLLFSALAASTQSVSAQELPQQSNTGRFVDHVYRDADGDHRYVVFEPAGYTPNKKWPVIFYLHGASGRGRDGRAQLIVGLGPAVKARADRLPFLVVFPQNENLRSRLLGGWNDGSAELDRALKILEEVERTYPVDRNHEILAGVSMGAFGAWELAAESPERWKAVVAISGGGQPEWVPSLSKVPIWAFHAADDQLVPPTRSSDLVEAINAAGGRAYVSILPRGGHNIGAPVFASDEVFAWLENPDAEPDLDIDWNVRRETVDMTDELRFVPGADVESAARIRVNRDLLESLSYVLADQIPADALQGWKPGTTQTERAGIATINVTVAGMHYSGHLEHAWITPLSDGRLRVQLGLRQLTMTITGTRLQGRLLSAQAGPMAIYIGYREPVWLTVDVIPQVVDRQLKLQAAGVHFVIPHHNWSISRPGVNVRGLQFLENRIADNLVEGVAEKKALIEQEIRNSVPQMLAQLEQRIATMCARTVTYRQWPMPLWQPRFRFYPEAVTVDEQGIELRLGALVAALAPRSDKIPVREFPAQGETLPASSDSGLDVAVSLRMIEAYSALLSASDVARFHVLDLNGEGFRALGRHEFWNSVLPADQRLSPETELNTEFVVTRPFQLRSLETSEDGTGDGLRHHLELALPQLTIQLATREAGQRDWADFAHVDLAFEQGLRLGIEKQGFSGRKLEVGFEPIQPPRVQARLIGADSPMPFDLHRIAEQFHAGWAANFGQVERDGRMADLKLGELALRWDKLGATEHQFVVQLKRPGIRIHNQSDAVVEYQVRGTATPWSDLLRLEPGQFHEFQSPTPLTWRSSAATGELQYTLPLGFEARFGDGKLTGVASRFPGPEAGVLR